MNNKEVLFSKKRKVWLWISGVFTIAIMSLMDFVFIPQIESTTNGIRCFDMQSFGYSLETAENFLKMIGENGKNIYLNIQLPLDFSFVIFYTTFISLLILLFTKRKSNLVMFPILLGVSDFIENSITFKMLKSEHLNQGIVTAGNCATIFKSVVMIICYLLIVVLLIKYIVNKRKNTQKGE